MIKLLFIIVRLRDMSTICFATEVNVTTFNAGDAAGAAGAGDAVGRDGVDGGGVDVDGVDSGGVDGGGHEPSSGKTFEEFLRTCFAFVCRRRRRERRRGR